MRRLTQQSGGGGYWGLEKVLGELAWTSHSSKEIQENTL
jgi:hypothetical protein